MGGETFCALALSDADLEELLRLAEAIAYDLSVSCFALSRILPDYLQRHGPHGANVLLNEVADVLRDDCYLDAAEVEALPETQRLVAKLQTSVVCDGCGRTRFGAKWKSSRCQRRTNICSEDVTPAIDAGASSLG